ncbi:uncharacterized protein [Anoplolepis gracilipes]|uniref:uncharacterized protein isoform X1 n=1 Tax=Anoplolepis gracilipes TaxID=354296 RepID=UPI003BA3261E
MMMMYHFSGKHFISFPLKNEGLLNKWLEIIPTTRNRISAYTQICSAHFEESQFKCINGKRFLNKDAMPSIFPFNVKLHNTSDKDKNQTLRCQQNTSKHMMSNNICNHYNSHCNMQKQEKMFSTNESSSTLNKIDKAIQSTPRTQNIAIQISPKQLMQSENEKNLRLQIKMLQKRLRYREEKISNVCELVKQLKKEGKCSDQLAKVLLKRLSVFNSKPFQNETENNTISIKKHSDMKVNQ